MKADDALPGAALSRVADSYDFFRGVSNKGK